MTVEISVLLGLLAVLIYDLVALLLLLLKEFLKLAIQVIVQRDNEELTWNGRHLLDKGHQLISFGSLVLILIGSGSVQRIEYPYFGNIFCEELLYRFHLLDLLNLVLIFGLYLSIFHIREHLAQLIELPLCLGEEALMQHALYRFQINFLFFVVIIRLYLLAFR